ncbi:MAG: asparagine synthetase B family protein [Erythrobacter sp.]
MTGIAAIFSPGPASERQLGAMMAAMAGRAHDGEGRWVHGRFALGASILHTTAEAMEAGQPHLNEDESLALVLDGYLANWEELRRDLTGRGAVLRNRSDAELVLRAYEQWGEDCADRIEGEFAFVIADRRKGRIYAARDHQGLRPLFYCRRGDTLVIASDIPAVFAALDPPPEPNHDYLAGVAAVQLFLPQDTVWREIKRLQQAHWLACDSDGLVTRRYYELPIGERLRYRSDEEYAEHYRAMLLDALRRTTRSHAPVGIAVSGGLDSSSLYCLADRLERQGQLLAPGFQGYTLAATPGSRAYELPYARAAADHIGRTLTEVPLFRPPLDWYIEQARTEHDLPIPTNGAMTIGIEQRVHADGSRVYINGDGGDEWLQGSLIYYREFMREGDVGGFIRALWQDAAAQGWRKVLPPALRTGLSAFVPHRLRGLRKAVRRARLYRDPDTYYWLRPEVRALLERQEAAYDAALPADPHGWTKENLFASPFGSYARARMQRQRGQNGIEPRHPMFTRQFIAFSLATPEHIRRRAGVTKVIHRIAMRGILPDMILARRTKADFESDAIDSEMGRFCREQGRSFLDAFCESSGLERLIPPGFVNTVDDDRSWELWGLYAVAAFLMLNSSSTGLSGGYQR